MYKLKYANVRRVVSTEKEKEELIKQGYSLYEQDIEEEQPKDEIVEEIEKSIEEVEETEEIEESKEAKKGRGRNAK